MAIFTKCCCCNLKIGNVVLGCLNLIGALIVLGKGAYQMNIVREVKADQQKTNDELKEIFAQLEFDVSGEDDIIDNSGTDLMMVDACVYLVLGIIFIVTNICLIVGAFKDIRQLIVVYLVVHVIFIVLILVLMLIVFIIFELDQNVLMTCLVPSAISMFLWLFPLSLYQDLRNSSARGASSATAGHVVLQKL